MSGVTLLEEAINQDQFYVPQFEIKIAKVGLPRDVLRDVMELTYHDDIDEIDGFRLTVNNWDDDACKFKYIGAETEEQLKSKPGEYFRLFEPSDKKVEVWMGYAGRLQLMLSGSFTTMETNFPSSGAPTLEVRGMNILHQLRQKQKMGVWEGKTFSEIAKAIAAPYDLPVRVEKGASESPLPYVAQQNQYDLDFLLSLARRCGYVLFVEEGDQDAQDPQMKKRRLYFGLSNARRDAAYELAWGASLINFKPTLTTANQVSSVKVKSNNRATKTAIAETATIDDQQINRDLYRLLTGPNSREEEVVDVPVNTEQEARERAAAILQGRLKTMVTATGTCIGLPNLRAGQFIRISKLGARLSGNYFITATTHTINDSGYTTSFDARREENGSGEGK